uniref:Tubulin folding cofactor B n=1 Tax=Aquila chrysaetos chrysaetos TaxID=223781 RepID=A0A663FK30_AQUCH
MDLELYGAEEQLLGRLDCDEALLGSYPVADGCRVHAKPTSSEATGWVSAMMSRWASMTAVW